MSGCNEHPTSALHISGLYCIVSAFVTHCLHTLSTYWLLHVDMAESPLSLSRPSLMCDMLWIINFVMVCPCVALRTDRSDSRCFVVA
jgi:hypothetical protein